MLVGVVTQDDAVAHRIEELVGAVASVVTAPTRAALTAVLGGREATLCVFDDDALVLEHARHPSQTDVERVIYRYPRTALASLLRSMELLLPCSHRFDRGLEPIRGKSPAVELVRDQLRSVARFPDISVLLLGDTGTGKELAARALHDASFGPDAPFVAINCAAIPESLLESELFGHEAGAFTGARGTKIGLFEAARGGTVFLDEVGEMPSTLQPKLLRVLESREFRRVGSNKPMKLEARVLSATNREPWDAGRGALRSDLVYRLAGFTIRLPPLRERGDDVDLLAAHFVRAFDERYGSLERELSHDARELLRAHDWPGNIRELRVILEHAAIVASHGIITASDVREALSAHHGDASRAATVAERDEAPADLGGRSLRAIERQLIARALEESGGNVSRAARQLGIPRSTLRSKMERVQGEAEPVFSRRPLR